MQSQSIEQYDIRNQPDNICQKGRIFCNSANTGGSKRFYILFIKSNNFLITDSYNFFNRIIRFGTAIA
jgi:hypothetical protein